MRIKRSLLLWPESANVHLYWRCHNREYYLEEPEIKDLYMKCLKDSLKYRDQGKNCHIHAYCLMSNHFHQSVTYFKGSENLSNFMRYAHGIFGARFNRLKDRLGKVAHGRPKTPRVQDDEHAMRLHFYIEANPIRARFRKLENLKLYKYSSYGFYAYGLKNEFTFQLTIPGWYSALGKTAQERQHKYRKLFRDYLKENEKLDVSVYLQKVIGKIALVDEMKAQILALFLELKENLPITLAPSNPSD